MSTTPDVDGVVITGVYGAGKSTVAAEIAGQLEAAGAPYAALDLDWLCWFDSGAGRDDEASERVFLANVTAVVGNYLAAGVRRFVLAGWVGDQAQLDRLRAAIAVPLRTVRLEVPLDEIERRLRADPTTGRLDDLAQTRRWLADGAGRAVGDLVVDNDAPIDVVARTIIEWLGWAAPRSVPVRRSGPTPA